jgi:hypothetical protein
MNLLPNESHIVGDIRLPRFIRLNEALIAAGEGCRAETRLSRGDTALLIMVVITLFILLPPTGEFVLMFLRRLSIAGVSALGVLIILLLVKFLKR